MRLHLACGDIYLEGYINIDLNGKVGKPAFITTIDKYYEGKSIGSPQEKIVDDIADVTMLPHCYQGVDEILAVHILEHFSFHETEGILRHWRDRLKPGGKLIIDVPDIVTVASSNDGDFWKMRQIYGSQKDPYSYHKAGFTKEILEFYLEKVGFTKWEFIDLIKHDYATITVEAIK